MSFEWGTIVKSINWTLVFNLVNFAILLYLLKRLLFKPALEYLDRRREAISERMQSARADEEKAARLAADCEEALQRARQQAEEIVGDARRRADAAIAVAKGSAKEEAVRILEEGKRQLEQERDRMIGELREAYADIAVLGAARVLDREVRIEDHQRLLDELLTEIGEDALRIGS
ncbi:F0F1 ATP synthase subunit B [Candidatus Bipolaricaulota bacterium]